MNENQKIVNFFDQVYHSFEIASANGSPKKINLSISGFKIRLNFANSALESKIIPSLAHLITETDAEPDFTINLWDSESTGVEMPARPWKFDQFSPRADVDSFSTRRIFAAFHLGANALSMVNNERSEAIYWIRSAAHVPLF